MLLFESIARHVICVFCNKMLVSTYKTCFVFQNKMNCMPCKSRSQALGTISRNFSEGLIFLMSLIVQWHCCDCHKRHGFETFLGHKWIFEELKCFGVITAEALRLREHLAGLKACGAYDPRETIAKPTEQSRLETKALGNIAL